MTRIPIVSVHTDFCGIKLSFRTEKRNKKVDSSVFLLFIPSLQKIKMYRVFFPSVFVNYLVP